MILNGDPRIIVRHKAKWEIIVEVMIVVVVFIMLTAVGWYYRRPIRRWYCRATSAYRERRRQVVFEEYNIPYNMYYEPAEIKNKTTLRSFETPYGEMYLVEPLIQQTNVEYGREFIVAASDV